MTVLQMVRNALAAGGYDGLYSATGECGCGKDDLSPGDCLAEGCEAAYEVTCAGCGDPLFSTVKATPFRCEDCGCDE